ncbi:MAG: hypothetical protein ACJ72D_27600, partial [Marmoricola sp.]
MSTMFSAYTTQVTYPVAPVDHGDLAARTATATADVPAFVTTSTLVSFPVMTGAIATAWGGFQQLDDGLDSKVVPFVLCMLFALVSVLASRPLTPAPAATSTIGTAAARLRLDWWAQVSFIALLNALTLYGAVLAAAKVVT